MFRYWKFCGWLMAGTVKKWSLLPSPCLAFFSWGKQKEAWTLPPLRGGGSDSFRETKMQERGERATNTSRTENLSGALLTADWTRSICLREQMQLHLPQLNCTYLHPRNRALAALSLSFFFSLSSFSHNTLNIPRKGPFCL